MDKKKESRGSIISSVGGLFTIVGLTLMTMESPAWITLTSMTLGVVLAVYGVFVIGVAGKKSN